MYFPSLKNLKKRQINDYDINILDWWLGTRKSNTLKYINPLQFSIDCNIDSVHALKIFSLCALDDSIGLFSVRYVAKCPNCNTPVSRQNDSFNKSSLPKSCYDCGSLLYEIVTNDFLEIYFTLLVQPQDIPCPPSPPVGVGKGIAKILQGSSIIPHINKNADGDIGRLFSCLK